MPNLFRMMKYWKVSFPKYWKNYVTNEPVKKKLKLHSDDIMGVQGVDMEVSRWFWRVHTSRTSGRDMLRVTYYGNGLSGNAVDEYLPVCNSGYAGDKATGLLAFMSKKAGASVQSRNVGGDDYDWLCDVADAMNNATPPSVIEYKKDGKFFRVIRREWNE